MYVVGNPILNDAKCVIQLAFPPYIIVDYRSFRLYSACTIPLRAIIASILLAEQYYVFHRHVPHYNRTDPSVSITPFHFLWKRTRTIKDNQEKDNQYTDIFQWHSNPMARNVRTSVIVQSHGCI